MSNLAEWLKRKCICRHPDRYECARIREIQQGCPPEQKWDDEPCECLCHDLDEGDEE